MSDVRCEASEHRWAVDLDLAQLFDRANHEVPMARLARRIGGRRVLRLIRRYLQAPYQRGTCTNRDS